MERWVEKHLRWLVIAPALIVLVFLIITPTIYLFVVAFQRFNPADVTNPEWVGFANFATVFSNEFFWNALKNTMIYIVFAVSIEFAAMTKCLARATRSSTPFSLSQTL